jgi:hypothetical protein
MFNLPEYKPLPGTVIIAFTAEQVATFNKVGNLFIADSFHPEQWSIEEALIIATSTKQENLMPGDSVLVDYSVFAAGRHEADRMRGGQNRFLFCNSEYYLYWCYDDQHPYNSSEIFATINDKGKCTAFGSVVLLYPFEESEELIDVIAKFSDLNDNQLPGASWALVYDSPVPEIGDGDLILCEKGLSPVIKFRGTELQYIRLSFIVGKAEKEEPYNLRLL